MAQTSTEHVLTENDLSNFYGSEEYYRYSPLFRNILLTEGAKYVADTAGAYWLMDTIAAMQIEPKIKREGFQVWKLKKDANSPNSAILNCEDGNNHEVYRQVIDYTDFPLDEIKFYFADNVIMLVSEY